MNPNEKNARRYGSMNQSMSRGGFVKTMGVGVAGLGMAATGFGGVGRAVGGGVPFTEFPQPEAGDFETIAFFTQNVEGLTADSEGYLYTVGRGGSVEYPGYNLVWRVDPKNPSEAPVIVGLVPIAPNNLYGWGLAFDLAGDLYIGTGNRTTPGGIPTNYGYIYKLTLNPDAATPPIAVPYTSLAGVGEVPGANGLAFDKKGDLWITDCINEQGRIWKIETSVGGHTAIEQFRVPTLGTYTPQLYSGLQPNTYGQPAAQVLPYAIVANGAAFNPKGDLFVSDTTRGRIWKVEFDDDRNIISPMLPDTNILDESNIFAESVLLAGADGIALDVVGNIWVTANARNAITVVTKNGEVRPIFQNPTNPGQTKTPTSNPSNLGPLQFPSSPFILGKELYITNSDSGRGDDYPPGGGEIPRTVNGITYKGKISHLKLRLHVPGMRLPVEPDY